MVASLVLFSVYISAVDLRHHRITNRTILACAAVFSALSAISGEQINPFSFLTVLAFIPLLLRLGIGAGDIKLLIVLSLFFVPFSWLALSSFMQAFTLLSALSLAYYLVRSRSFAGSVALAPALCGAVIWCAR